MELWFEEHYRVSFDDEAGLAKKLEDIIGMFEGQNN